MRFVADVDAVVESSGDGGVSAPFVADMMVKRAFVRFAAVLKLLQRC